MANWRKSRSLAMLEGSHSKFNQISEPVISIRTSDPFQSLSRGSEMVQMPKRPKTACLIRLGADRPRFCKVAPGKFLRAAKLRPAGLARRRQRRRAKSCIHSSCLRDESVCASSNKQPAKQQRPRRCHPTRHRARAPTVIGGGLQVRYAVCACVSAQNQAGPLLYSSFARVAMVAKTRRRSS